ncbi:putative loganate O-methyltransferase [Rosa chinensis]|uniref:Putative loganate O-methyltransferase n=1 Tax=Rosa chinensis TaxID=74649 RepID=A0A2P6QSY7_ROSCH|nr:putative loganate O-methyltransferase [Rosa chinensis]
MDQDKSPLCKNCTSKPDWNKGRIHYLGSTDEVVRAYKAQYSENMNSFLHARAEELVYGGLLVLIIPGYPQGTPLSPTVAYLTLQVIEACLIDMVGKGVISEEKLDSFNIPMYSICPQELEAVVEQNGSFSIETLETIPHVLADDAVLNAKQLAAHGRAVLEGLIKQQFGKEITDELFDLYGKKMEKELSIFKQRKRTNFLVVLKRKAK